MAPSSWQSVLTLNEKREPIAGSTDKLNVAIRRGADLRIYTEFRHNEHLVPGAENDELVEEVSEFRVTYLIDNRWSAGIMTLRQPIEPPYGFGPRPSMSFFMYNQNGQQAIARPYLDKEPVTGKPGPSPLEVPANMPKYHALDNWDAGTRGPSHNFIYDFGEYRFCVRDDWRELLHHDENGKVLSGSLDEFADSFRTGCELKVGITNLCEDLSRDDSSLPHEVFIQLGPGYYHTQTRIFSAGSHPLVRVLPNIPLQYASRNWDCGWLMPRTDGFLARQLLDPLTQEFVKSESKHAMRWFVR
ncbi:hypothetical protein Pla110_11290 [Polystyrenella longa]|uniref:Uncharacterized protein n=1 Tax=Polystyrenella longa TaxID=2528007 RepID=A0A518CJL1_9PLAN|nr:hypothetical protein [Polystyrenella longa]QDU79419.1 hypothetical protein Pla110_11290 [Polystyrenella longa]